MKSKIFVSILLAVVMLCTLATPAFAGKPQRGDLLEWTGGTSGGPIADTETGRVSLQRTRDDYIKISLVLEGAIPGEKYWIRAPDGTPIWPDSGNYQVYANQNGVLRVRLTSWVPQTGTSFQIVVKEGPTYNTDWDFGTNVIIVPSN